MTDGESEILSEEEAARVWERAAELQAHAAGDMPTAPVESEGERAPAGGYALAQVRSAALEAGIAYPFVDAALADLRMARLHGTERRGHPLARRFLNRPPATIKVRRVVEATPRQVLSAMEVVFPGEPFRLTLTDQQGDALGGGIMTFSLPGVRSPFERGFAFEAADAGLKQLFVSVRAVDDPAGGCEIIAQSPVTSHNVGFGVGMLLTTLSGSAGMGGLGALGVAIGIGPVGVIGGVLIGAGLGAGLGVKGYRALYHSSMRKATGALDGLLGAVAARSQGLWQG